MYDTTMKMIFVILALLLTPFTPWLDLTVSRYFYSEGHFVSNAFTEFLFDYGVLPAWILFISGIIALILSYFPRWKRGRSPALLLVLTMVIGTQFIIHNMLKDHWGRPRPKQVIEFGGEQNFRPFYQPNFFNQPEPSKGFPCGHCAMGFYFFSLAFIGRRLRIQWLYVAGISVALILGTALGVMRIAQGGHFLSDVLVSALVMWVTAWVCDWIIYSR